MSKKLCVTCNKKPRHVSKSGKEQTKCIGCLREYWRDKKAQYAERDGTYSKKNSPANPDGTRKCKVCGKTKPLSEFGRWGTSYRTHCKSCKSNGRAGNQSKPARSRSCKKHGKHVLLVNGDQVVLARVLSKSDEIRNKALIIDIYREQGYDITHVFESEDLA